MTTFFERDTRCALCGSVTRFSIIGSTNSFGSVDLDTRPPEMRRSTMNGWVQRCKACGYCASVISEAIKGADAVIKTAEYREQLCAAAYPTLANSFLCKGITDHAARDFASATWALVHAAWACDDAKLLESAAKCRKKAADMLLIAESHDQRVSGQDGGATALLVDLLRRSGQFVAARRAIVERPADVPAIITQVLTFQSKLIEKNDTAAYVISDALGGVKSSPVTPGPIQRPRTNPGDLPF